jgi:hypothetical protein
MVALSAPLPPKETLADHMDVNAPREYQTSIEFLCLNGTDKGEQVVYKASSKGGINAMDDLIKAIGLQLDADDTKPVPVVKFAFDTYNHKEYGKTYVPVLEVVDWIELTDKIPDVGEVQQRVADPVKEAAAAMLKPFTVTKSSGTTLALENDDREAAILASDVMKQLGSKLSALTGR